MAAILVVSVGGMLAGSAVIARHRAQSAADLAALAAAGTLAAGPDVACRQARSVGSAMGAALDGCTVEDLDVVVICSVPVPGGSGLRARAAARAGPQALS